MPSNSYANKYRNIDFKKNPEKYCIGRGEQGVLIAEPYKSEILPYWRFKTPAIAKESATKIYELFLNYKANSDFVGMDMARKFLQMGFTRSRRYANHANGKKYDNGILLPQDDHSEESDKAKSAKIFLEFYLKAKNDELYKKLYEKHKAWEKTLQISK
ncbi:MAG: DUF4385 domain-containing protein [Tatlockia sp.]|nr:DUF4385 domain-containing protein [Tatlockia sp.]